MTKLEFDSSKQDSLIPSRAEFNTTNLHFERMASFVSARRQLQSSARQRDDEDLYTVRVEIN
eukprot:9373345-Alexandrium_andersonii.AAC.1